MISGKCRGKTGTAIRRISLRAGAISSAVRRISQKKTDAVCIGLSQLG
jgi:hypothetical protein